MKAIFFARVKLRHLTFEQVVEAYAGWTLGVDAYRKNRDRRLDLGVPSHLSSAGLTQGGSFRGNHDCSISSRRTDAAFLLRFIHRDADEGATATTSSREISGIRVFWIFRRRT